MQVLIVEDEMWGAERLQEMVFEADPEIQVAGIVGSIADAVAWFKGNPTPDLIFLDIELSDGQSFEIFNQVSISCPVIFTTSYSEYALKAFELNSIDYLLKPIRLADLRKSLKKLREMKAGMHLPAEQIVKFLQQLSGQPPSYKTRFLVKRGIKLKKIEAGEIAYFFGEDRLVFVVTVNGEKHIIDHKLEELETVLDPSVFYRANRSFIVHIQAVQDIAADVHGKLRLQLSPPPSKQVMISREKAVDFKVWLGK